MLFVVVVCFGVLVSLEIFFWLHLSLWSYLNVFKESSSDLLPDYFKLENVFIKHYAPNHMPDPKEE